MIALRRISLLLLVVPAAALSEDPKGHSLGLVAGLNYGVGISYGRHNAATGTSWQVSGLPFLASDSSLLFVGGTFSKTLHEGEKWGVLWSLGASFFSIRSEEEKGSLVAFGPGVGLKRKYSSNYSSTVGLSVTGISSDGEFAIFPYPNIALTYRW